MRVLVSRGGQLVAATGPVCDYPDCTECAGLAALDSAHLIATATVADRQDVTFEDLEAAAAHFLKITGWTDAAPDLAAELAHDMACQAAEVASRYEPGTQLQADYDRRSDEWTFRVIRSVSA
jgi:hypothetical protein